MNYKYLRNSSVLIIYSIFVLNACGPETLVQLSQTKYKPSFSTANFSDYKGCRINLVSFTNDAQNTNIWHYYNPDRTIYYEVQQAVHSYLWYTFRDAFRYAGIGVYEDSPHDGIHDFQLTMLSLNDQFFDFRVKLLKDGFMIMNKDFSVKMDSVKSKDASALEKNAYALIDKSVITILNDPEFHNAMKK